HITIVIDPNNDDNSKIKIITKLWDHQKKTVDKIIREIDEKNICEFGDASDVGSGKSVTILSVMARLYEKMAENNSHSGFLVLLFSSTFFKARFDKLFYMLKMLKTGLPENKQCLDAILAQSIVMNLPLKTREWEISYNPMKSSKHKERHMMRS